MSQALIRVVFLLCNGVAIMRKFNQGTYLIQNPAKYAGKKQPQYKSSWEKAFMVFCDTHPNILFWAYEPIVISYLHPFTGRKANYIPDFLIQYINRSGDKISELCEIKPNAQILGNSLRENETKAGIINQAKWQQARAWCKEHGIIFRIITENDIFANKTKYGKPRKSSKKRKRR